MTQDIEPFRAGFEEWARTRHLGLERSRIAANIDYARSSTNEAWCSWTAAKLEANTEPSAIRNAALEEAIALCKKDRAWRLVDGIRALKAYGVAQKDEAKGAAPGDALDAARYRIIRSGATGNDALTVATLFITSTELDEITDAAIATSTSKETK